MISADRIVTAVTDALRSNSTLVSALGGLLTDDGSPTILPHYFYGGADNAIAKVVGNMRSGQIVLGVASQLGGNFDGATNFKHKLDLYIRARNASALAINDPAHTPAGLWGLWALVCNGAITNPVGTNIRSVRLLSGDLDLIDTPTAILRAGEDTADYLYCSIMCPEWNDSLSG